MQYPIVFAEITTAVEKITEAAEKSGAVPTMAIALVVIVCIVLLVNLMVWLDNRMEAQTMKREELREKQSEEREKLRSEQMEERETLREKLWTAQLGRYEEALKLLVESVSEGNKGMVAVRDLIASMDKRLWSSSQLEDMIAARTGEALQKHVERYHERPTK